MPACLSCPVCLPELPSLPPPCPPPATPHNMLLPPICQLAAPDHWVPACCYGSCSMPAGARDMTAAGAEDARAACLAAFDDRMACRHGLLPGAAAAITQHGAVAAIHQAADLLQQRCRCGGLLCTLRAAQELLQTPAKQGRVHMYGDAMQGDQLQAQSCSAASHTQTVSPCTPTQTTQHTQRAHPLRSATAASGASA